MKYKRYFQPGGMFFFTLVTYKRRKLFVDERSIDLFNASVQYVQIKHPFEMDAYCICPDHIHMIWTLPEDEVDYPTRLRLLKSHFSHHYIDGDRLIVSESRKKNGEKDIWQRRYWEHFIRDEDDYLRHLEYIHYNPVKHGLVNAPALWRYSSFSEYVEQGLYPVEWGNQDEMEYIDNAGHE